MDEERLSSRLLAEKNVVAAFVRPGVLQETVETFDEEFAKGRDIGDTWVVHPTRSHGECGLTELLKIATTKFKAADCGYYPYFVILIDDRTTEDGTVLLGQQDPWYPPVWALRITPRSLSCFLSVADIGHTTIEGVLANDKPEGDDSWVHDVPFDYTVANKHRNARHLVSLSQDEDKHQNVESISRVTVNGLTIQWYGELPESVLVLSGVYNGKREVCA
ncbi:uncharacterized protein TrAtP1_007610 [Trichoderma atroviride]|uniref:uncharacterized protein n=1 Tax=Hypocrea atroviridis TaxID=63577 RepID=UPI0033199998|nr:hypothetical protein TrAtP1_007610 [Trichoderma atroviride]